MKQFFRFFSLGLFVASLIIFIFYNYFEEPEANPNDFSKEELVEIIEDDGYRVITEEDYISYTVNEDENNEDLNIDEKELEEEENQDSNDEDENEDNNVEYTLEITSGMMPHEVIALLEEEDIIEDADKFSEFMDKNDYSPYIQQGEFELTSDMSDEDIAKAITNKYIQKILFPILRK